MSHWTSQQENFGTSGRTNYIHTYYIFLGEVATMFKRFNKKSCRSHCTAKKPSNMEVENCLLGGAIAPPSVTAFPAWQEYTVSCYFNVSSRKVARFRVSIEISLYQNKINK